MMHFLVEAAQLLPLDAFPDPVAAPPPGGDKFLQVLGWLKWVCLGIVIAGFIVIGAMMAVRSENGEGQRHVGKVGWAITGAILISASVSIVGFAAT